MVSRCDRCFEAPEALLGLFRVSESQRPSGLQSRPNTSGGEEGAELRMPDCELCRVVFGGVDVGKHYRVIDLNFN